MPRPYRLSRLASPVPNQLRPANIKLLLKTTWSSVQMSVSSRSTSRRLRSRLDLSLHFHHRPCCLNMMSPCLLRSLHPLRLRSSFGRRLVGSAVLRPDVGVRLDSRRRPLASVSSVSLPRSSPTQPQCVAAVSHDFLFQPTIAGSVVLRPGVGPLRDLLHRPLCPLLTGQVARLYIRYAENLPFFLARPCNYLSVDPISNWCTFADAMSNRSDKTIYIQACPMGAGA